METPERGFFVSHVHWDRAWYLPFQSFRHRLVRTLDALLDLLESDRAFSSFTLDGQTVILEDYLALRPSQETRLRALIAEGRIHVGPWYTLPDLFLTGGEGTLRNLQKGLKQSRSWKEQAPAVGYVPDSFGHFGQLPQILSKLKIDSYFFMRGLPEEFLKEKGPHFSWQAPDGSSVHAVCLFQGYMTASALGFPSEWGRWDFLEAEKSLAIQRVRSLLDDLRPTQKVPLYLFCQGSDHMPPQKTFPQVLEALREELSDITWQHSHLAAYLEVLKKESFTWPTYTGDLVGQARHPILSQVYSTRQYLKLANFLGDHALRFETEPLCGLLPLIHRKNLPVVQNFLDEAWRLWLLNQAHDDISGCSHDDVHLENEARFQEVQQITQALFTEQLEQLLEPTTDSSTQGESALFLWNPHPFPQEFTFEAESFFAYGENVPVPQAKELSVRDARNRHLSIDVLETQAPVVRSAFLETSWGRRYRWRGRKQMAPCSYEILRVRESSTNLHSSKNSPEEIPPDLKKLLSSFYYELQTDRGDTYSFGADPLIPPQKSRLLKAKNLSRPHSGDQYKLVHVVFRPETQEPLEITSLWSRFSPHSWSLQIEYQNSLSNVRLRGVFHLGFEAKESWTHQAFEWRRHTPTPLRDTQPRTPSYPGEQPYPTRFQGCVTRVERDHQQAWVFNRGLHEYELRSTSQGTGSEIAITLHRSVGKLSVSGNAQRSCQAGPSIETPTAQCHRFFQHTLAFGLTDSPRPPEEVLQEAFSFSHPLTVREMPVIPGTRLPSHLEYSFLEGDNPHIVFSTLKAHEKYPGEDLVLRLYNSSTASQTLQLKCHFPLLAWCESDLREEWNTPLEKPAPSLSLEFGPGEIKTLLLKKGTLAS